MKDTLNMTWWSLSGCGLESSRAQISRASSKLLWNAILSSRVVIAMHWGLEAKDLRWISSDDHKDELTGVHWLRNVSRAVRHRQLEEWKSERRAWRRLIVIRPTKMSSLWAVLRWGFSYVVFNLYLRRLAWESRLRKLYQSLCNCKHNGQRRGCMRSKYYHGWGVFTRY